MNNAVYLGNDIIWYANPYVYWNQLNNDTSKRISLSLHLKSKFFCFLRNSPNINRPASWQPYRRGTCPWGQDLISRQTLCPVWSTTPRAGGQVPSCQVWRKLQPHPRVSPWQQHLPGRWWNGAHCYSYLGLFVIIIYNRHSLFIVWFIFANFKESFNYTHECHLESNTFQADGEMVRTVILI